MTKNQISYPFFLFAVVSLCGSTLAGYEAPCHIDGCQSIDGRYTIKAEMTSMGKNSHGPHTWDFIWHDSQTDTTKRFPAKGVQAGQIYAQLFIAPDGETFALFNHVTLWEPEQSHMHGPKELPHHEETEAWQSNERFSHRIIIYRKDGTMIKQLGIKDLLLPEEWQTVGRVFNRVHWLVPYDGLNFKSTPRTQYAFYRVSPDYTVLEMQATQPRAKRRESPRVIRVSLVDGEILSPSEQLPKAKTPVRPFQGDDHLPKSGPAWKESYTPSLDPVRTPGTYEIVAADVAFASKDAPKKLPEFAHGDVRLIQDGFEKADTPSWLPKPTGKNLKPRLLFTDLELDKFYEWIPNGGPPTVVRQESARGKVFIDGRFYGVIDGQLVRWRLDQQPEVILEKGHSTPEVSLNDIAVSSKGLIYFTTLKDPDKGRLSLVDPESKQVQVLFDGEQNDTLVNPNGVALSKHERFLYVGISNYKNRKFSGVYAFPIRADGTIDVETGMAKKWAAVKAPDGIAVDKAGNVYFTAGGAVHVFDPYGRRWGMIKIPKGSGTNLAFGGDGGNTLFITTWNALYAVDLK